MVKEKEQHSRRVAFEHPLPAHMMPIDGTWRRACTIKDVSDHSATLVVESSIEGLALQEFFLLLSSAGLAYRRCQLDAVNGGEICVSFLRSKPKKKTSNDRSGVNLMHGNLRRAMATCGVRSSPDSALVYELESWRQEAGLRLETS